MVSGGAKVYQDALKSQQCEKIEFTAVYSEGRHIRTTLTPLSQGPCDVYMVQVYRA